MTYLYLSGGMVLNQLILIPKTQAVITRYGKQVPMAYLATGFQEADTDDSGSLLSCLRVIEATPFFAAVKEESYRLLSLSHGSRALDVGCGTGTDAYRLAALTGRDGMVVGIDPGAGMLENAISSGPSLLHQGPAPSFLRMDGRFLAFPDSSFDAVREDRALQHIREQQEVVREMFRVLRPGGRFVFFEPDWELFIIDGTDRALTRRLLHFWADSFRNGWVGRELFRLCCDGGAGEVSVLPRTMILHDLGVCDQIFGVRETLRLGVEIGVVDEEAGSRWLVALEEADRSGRFFASFTGYLVHGRR